MSDQGPKRKYLSGQSGASVDFLTTIRWREVRLPDWAKKSDRFILCEVCGDSLSGAGMVNGDYALVFLTTDIQDGDLVAALTPEGMLIKFFWQHYDGEIRLEGANPLCPARYYDPADINIQGKVLRPEWDW